MYSDLELLRDVLFLRINEDSSKIHDLLEESTNYNYPPITDRFPSTPFRIYNAGVLSAFLCVALKQSLRNSPMRTFIDYSAINENFPKIDEIFYNLQKFAPTQQQELQQQQQLLMDIIPQSITAVDTWASIIRYILTENQSSTQIPYLTGMIRNKTLAYREESNHTIISMLPETTLFKNMIDRCGGTLMAPSRKSSSIEFNSDTIISDDTSLKIESMDWQGEELELMDDFLGTMKPKKALNDRPQASALSQTFSSFESNNDIKRNEMLNKNSNMSVATEDPMNDDYGNSSYSSSSRSSSRPTAPVAAGSASRSADSDGGFSEDDDEPHISDGRKWWRVPGGNANSNNGLTGKDRSKAIEQQTQTKAEGKMQRSVAVCTYDVIVFFCLLAYEILHISIWTYAHVTAACQVLDPPSRREPPEPPEDPISPLLADEDGRKKIDFGDIDVSTVYDLVEELGIDNISKVGR